MPELQLAMLLQVKKSFRELTLSVHQDINKLFTEHNNQMKDHL
jgi:hypothetical protein